MTIDILQFCLASIRNIFGISGKLSMFPRFYTRRDVYNMPLQTLVWLFHRLLHPLETEDCCVHTTIQ